MSSSNRSLYPENSEEWIVVILCCGTIAFGLVAAVCTTVYWLFGGRSHGDTPYRFFSTLCKPSCCSPFTAFVSGLISFILILIEIAFVALAFMSGLKPASSWSNIGNDGITRNNQTSSSSTTNVVIDIRNWLKDGTSSVPSFNFSNSDIRLSLYFGGLTLVSLLWAIVSPYFLTWAFQLYAGGEVSFMPKSIPTFIRKVVKMVWKLMKLAVGWVIVRACTFLLSYYSVAIISIFILVPWDFALKPDRSLFPKIGYCIWTFVISALVISCFTTQGFWAAVVRAMLKSSGGRFDNLFKNVGRVDAKNLFGKLIVLVLYILKISLIFIIFLAIHIVKIIIGYPEPQVMQLPPPCFWCREWCRPDGGGGAGLTCKQSCGLIMCPQFVAKDAEMNHHFFDEDNPPPPMIEWARFCSSYSLSFIMPIPIAGPFLYLIGTMLSRTGFWMSPFWLFLQKQVREHTASDGKGGEKTKTKAFYYCPVVSERSSAAKKDFVVGFFYRLFSGLRDSDYSYFVNPNKDNGRVLRTMLMVLIPLVALLPIFLPYTRTQGFDLFGTITAWRLQFFR